MVGKALANREPFATIIILLANIQIHGKRIASYDALTVAFAKIFIAMQIALRSPKFPPPSIFLGSYIRTCV